MIMLATVSFTQNDMILIDEIEVLGNSLLTDENIKFISGLEKGMYINNFNIQNSINQLWDTKRYIDVKIDIEKKYMGNKLTIYVEEANFINEIVFENNQGFSDKTLLKKIDIEKGNIINFNDIYESSNLIRDHYKSKNYHNVNVGYRIVDSDSDPNSKVLVFEIYEGKKIKIKKITISGNQDFSKNIILKQFQNTKLWKWYWPFRGKFSRSNYELDKLILAEFYYNQGYKDFQINGDSVSMSDESIDIYLNIEEGNKYYIRNVSFEGNQTKSDSTLYSVMGIKKGDLFDKSFFNQYALESIRSLYMNEGFLNFSLEPIIRPIINDGKSFLDIEFILNENQIFTINKILISGNKNTYENVIRRELDVFPGDIFDRNKLYQSVGDLWRLNFFNTVEPRVIPISDNKIDLEIEVSEKSVGTANFSMGYNQIYGFQGGGGFEFPNFRGRGQTVSLTYQRGLSGNNYSNSQSVLNSYSSNNVNKYESFSVSFFEPSLFDTPNIVGVSISHSERGQNENSYWPFDTDNSRLSLRFGRRKLKWPDRYFKITWSYSYSRDRSFSSTLQDITSYWGQSIEPYVDFSNNEYVFKTSGVSISQNISRDSRDRSEFPTKGSRIKLNSTLSGSLLGGDHDYIKNTFEMEFYRPLSDKNLVLSQVFKAGSLEPIDMPSNQRSIVPISARYFMGGSGMSYGEMLRGYQQNSIGPYDYRPRGGNLMMKYSLEIRLLFSADPTVYGFLFADMGNVWSDYDILKTTDLKKSLGVGVRVHMPMLGILGYDVGYGFDETIIDNGEAHGWEHHFVFGMPIN